MRRVRSPKPCAASCGSCGPADALEPQLRAVLGRYPPSLREGPWSPCAYLLHGLLVVLLLAAPAALTGWTPAPEVPGVAWHGLRAALLAHMLAISRQMLGCGVPCMLATYTMCSWHLTCLHLALTLLPFRLGHEVAHVLFFPMVLTSLITLVIWWAVVVPLACVWSTAEQRQLAVSYFSTHWSKAWGMVNVHGFNALFACGEAWVCRRELTVFDLWAGLVYSIGYGLFYVYYLDPRGLHYYIAMSPRPHWCAVIYLGVMSGVVALWLVLRSL